MKRVFMSLLLTAMTIGAYAQTLTLTNHGTCTVYAEIFASDIASGYGPCVLQSHPVVLPPGGPSVIFVGVPSVTAWPAWLNPLAFPAMTGIWNAVKFTYPNDCGSWVGDVTSCNAPRQWSGFCCSNAGGVPVLNQAFFTPMGGGNVNVDWY